MKRVLWINTFTVLGATNNHCQYFTNFKHSGTTFIIFEILSSNSLKRLSPNFFFKKTQVYLRYNLCTVKVYLLVIVRKFYIHHKCRIVPSFQKVSLCSSQCIFSPHTVHWSITYLKFCLFQNAINGILYIAFWVLQLLSILYLRFIHIVTCFSNLFLFSVENSMYGWTREV